MTDLLQENTSLEAEQQYKNKNKTRHFRMDTHQSNYNNQLRVYKSALKQINCYVLEWKSNDTVQSEQHKRKPHHSTAEMGSLSSIPAQFKQVKYDD